MKSDDVIYLHGNYVMITKWQPSWVSSFAKKLQEGQN